MKVIKKDYKNGEVVVVVDQALDLWHLSKIITPKDIVEGITERKIVIDRGEKKEIYRKKVYLSISVEKVSWNEDVLRITGTIIDGPEDIPRGDHHSFNVRINDKIKIKKQDWNLYKSLLEKYSKEKEYNLLVIVFDRSEAMIAEISNNGYKVITELRISSGPKEEAIKTNYKELAKLIEMEYKKKSYDGLIIGSPQFFKDYLLKELDEEIRKKAVVVNISYAGMHGLKEVISNDSIRKAFSKIKQVRDEELMNELKLMLSKGLVVYGLSDVKNYLEMGNMKKLLINENFLHNARINDIDLQPLMALAENINAEIEIINDSKELEALGGIAGILRYKNE